MTEYDKLVEHFVTMALDDKVSPEDISRDARQFVQQYGTEFVSDVLRESLVRLWLRMYPDT